MSYAHLEREPRNVRDHTRTWERLTPLAKAGEQVRVAVERFCERKRITVSALEALDARVTWRKGHHCLAYAGLNQAGTAVVAIKYRPLEGTSHDSEAEPPSVWLRPIVIGNHSSLDWLVAEGETDAARLHGLIGDRCAVLVLPSGAATFKEEWARSIPRGATVALCHDADQDGDAGAQKAARVIGGRTLRVRPPVEGADWCDWEGDRAAFVQLVQQRQADPTMAKLRVLDVATMLTTPPPPVPWVVEPILARGCVTMLAGREGRGKSMIALALAAAVGQATSLVDIAGMPAGLSGHVLYIDAENGEHEAHRRVHGLKVQAGALTYVEAAGGFDLKQHLGDLEQLVRKCEPKLLVLDSLRSLAPGLDENDSMQAEAALRPVVRLTQQLQIATLILHHASRMSGEYRGSTAIGAAVELGFTLSRHDEDPMGATRRKLSCWKSRPAAEPEPRWLTIKPDITGDILLMEAAPYELERPTPVQDGLEDMLKRLVEGRGTRGTTPMPRTTGTTGWSLGDFGDAMGRRKDDKTLRRAVQRLEDAGLIHRNGDGRWQPMPDDGEAR